MAARTKFVSVPTFVNPHLFWIVESHSDERIKTLRNINKVMQDEYKFHDNSLNDSFQIGDIVAVSVDSKFYRAIIEDIPKPEAREKNVSSFLCWLIDYGTMIEVEVVYKLSCSLRKVAPLASQASLNNVAYVRQHLTFDHKSGLPTKANEPILTPTSIAHQVSLELMSNLSDLQFITENKVDGIFLGDILYKENQEFRSLRQTLIDRGILVIKEILFKEIRENIYSYKEENLWLIAQICKKLNSIQFLKEDDNSWCEKIISKYLKEFEENDLFDDVELTRPIHIRRSRSRNTTNSSHNSVNSGNESISDIDTPSKSESSYSSKGKSPRNHLKLLLERMRNQKHNSEDTKCVSTSNLIKNNDPEPCNNTKEPLSELNTSRDKEENLGISETHVNQSTLGDMECKTNSQPRKRVIPKNSIFVPGGATFSLNMSKKAVQKSSKQKVCVPKMSSEEDTSSDCKIINATNKSIKEESSSSTPSDEPSGTEDRVVLKEVKHEHVKQLQIKPFCTCKQCEHWTNDNDWQIETNFSNESKQTKHLIASKPQTLFLLEGQNVVTDRTIIALDYSSMTKLQKQATPKLLVHGEYSQTPLRLVSEVYFHECIRNTLRQLRYREAKRIQMYAWPAILRQQHVVMVSGSQTGKTMAYLPVILTFLLEKNERYEPFAANSGGPIVVILCANTKKCEEIYDLSKLLLGRNRLKVSLITYPLSHINTKHIDMLVTTPTILIDLLKIKAINFKRLCHLILEDGDKILKQESEIMKRLFDLTQSMLGNRVHLKPVQLIVCAEHWNLRLENLVQKLNKMPLICIGNHLEAALYGKMQFSMKFVNSACKEHELKNLLQDTFRICKSIILCKKEEIEDIRTILMLKGIDATIISEDLSKEDIVYLEEVWTQCKGGEYTVLVCTDFILNSVLTVVNASLLIHYSLPSSWTQFVKRFGCLLENCKSPLDSKKTHIKCQSVILCDEECENHMSKFFKFMESTELKNQLPAKFKSFSEDLKHVEEQKKLKGGIELCETLKLFGTCSAIQCPRRHILHKNVDIPDYLPQSGKIKFKITHIQDVATYSVQLIQHIDMENNIRKFEDNSVILEDLTNIIRISRKQVINPMVGHLYAYYDMDELDGVYYRCDLLELDGDCIRIKLIDKGNIICTVKNRLFKLPKEFRNKPRKIIDVHLANFIPPYRDENFSAKSFMNVKNLLEKHDYKNIIMTGNIHLQLGHALWLENVYGEVKLSEKIIPGFQLTREILVLKQAEYNNHQLNNLYKLCKEASISLPIYENPVKRPMKEERKIEPQWAHLNMDVNEVTFSAAVSPDEIYIRLNKFNQQLYNLQKEIQESLKKPNYPNIQNVKIGTIGLAKDPEGVDYARIIVKNIENDKALCFFVDFGDEAVINITELKYIHNKHITKLPFQSIQCRLHGIRPVLDEWQNEITNILYEYATEPNTDVFRLLFAKVCSIEANEIHHKQNRYSVLLKDGFGEKRVLINNLFIECGVALLNSEQIDDFEICSTGYETDESDEELEHIIDICRKTEEVEENICVNGDRSVNKDVVNEDMELFLIDAEGFFKSLLTINNDTKQRNRFELPAIQAAPAVDYYTPEVYWSQTEKYIKLDIKLHDVEDYTLNLTRGTIMHFKTVKNEKTYKLNIMLYQRVSSVQHTAFGPQVRVTLAKINDCEWPRLTLSKQRTRNIHYDISTIIIKEDTKKILELPKMLDDDEESDDDIDIMYHVVSDIDSDFDADLQRDSD